MDYDEDARWLLVHRGNLRIAANLAGPAQGKAAARILVGLSGAGLSGAGQTSVLAASNQGVSVADGAVLLPPESLAVIDVSDPPSL